MSKTLVGSLLALVLGSGLALADDKADAQKKVDAAKTETCEKVKKFIADQNAKGRCTEEHTAAQKITCAPATFKDMNDLNAKCAKAPAAKDDKAPEGGTECRAVDADSKTIAKADDKSSVKCGTMLMEAVKKEKCTADMKGKKIEYTVQSDHLIGKTKIKDRKTSLTCTAPKK